MEWRVTATLAASGWHGGLGAGQRHGSRAAPSSRSAALTPACGELDAAALHAGLAERFGVYASNRGGMLRFSPHVYNTEDDKIIDAALHGLRELLLHKTGK